jgi:beta-phosphoglucomutase-like phosphatase (HAD superfamily)
VSGSGVFVDVDGTLVDSNSHHTIAWSRALRVVALYRDPGDLLNQLDDSLIGKLSES